MEYFAVSGLEILNWRREHLINGGDSKKIDWLLDFSGGLCGSSLQKIKIDSDKEIFLTRSLEELSSLWRKHRRERIPLQYLVGKCSWRDFELEINQSALIPRQETELLVDLALSKAKNFSKGIWVDLGTGSGAIAISLARSLPNWIGHAVDSSKDALSLAEKNLGRLVKNRNYSLHLGSWWEPLEPWKGKFNLVIANPPYIPEININSLEPEVRNHEPYVALCGGPDGLSGCRQVINGAMQSLANKGWLMLEHHHDQSSNVLELMRKSGLEELDSCYDFNRIKRFAIGRRP